MTSGFILKHSFQTCEALSQAINARRQVTVSQLSLNAFRCDLLLIEFDQIQFSFISELSGPVRVMGPKGKDCLEFSLILQPGRQEVFAHQFGMDQNTLFGFDPTREVDLIVPAQSQICVIQIQQAAFEACTQIMERNDLDAQFLKTNYITAPEFGMGVQAYLKELYDLATHQPEFLRQAQSHRIVLEDFLPLLVDAIPFAPQKLNQSLHQPRRFNLVKQADEYMRANLEVAMTLMDLCKALNTSERPLSYGFREVFGISPMAYLKALRLLAVRQQLQMADPTTTIIADVASQFGFWSLGHFSRDYKTMFGELPSQTLNKTGYDFSWKSPEYSEGSLLD
jgi:AraC family transcriptional regulator, ethanolamine operon transcriptional activator